MDDSIVIIDLGSAPEPDPEDKIEQLTDRIWALQQELWAAQNRTMDGAAVARLVGRVAKVERPDGDVQWGAFWLACEDGEGGKYQAIKVRAKVDDLVGLNEGLQVELACVFRRGRLTLDAIEKLTWTEDEMPEVQLPDPAKGQVPDWFSQAKNAPKDLLKASDGSSSVSDLRVHIVFATKRRGKILTAPMIDRLKALVGEVVKDKNLGRLLAVNGEDDHVHVALWLPVNVAGSEAAGLIKSYTARYLRREFPELRGHDDESLWQRGCYVGAIGSGGDLSTVLAYIAGQNAPTE